MFKKTFLVEIGTEELPAKLLRNLAESFSANFTFELDNTNLIYDTIKWFATPRRLALKVENLVPCSLDSEMKKFDSYTVNKHVFMKKTKKIEKDSAYDHKVSVRQVKNFNVNKYDSSSHQIHVNSTNLEDLLSKIVSVSLKKLPVKKLMRWGVNDAYFIRPIRTVTLLLDDKTIHTNIFGIQSDRIIFGHRFMGESKFVIESANQYPKILLERGKVIANYEMRKLKIKSDIEKRAHKIGGNVDLDENLLEEVTALVEWPVVLSAKFEEKFLIVPKEVLIFILKNHQKCFPIYAANGSLLPHFIFVVNIESSDPKKIISGNERVICSRMADAVFFFETDCKVKLEDNLSQLQLIIFQDKLGTLYDKAHRISKLSGWIAQEIGADISHAIRAGLLSKCDLTTKMVFEFTDTRGIMGMHYARKDGEAEDVALALMEHYYPRFSKDKLPSSLIACAVAIADKIDTLIGIFGINQHLKKNRDPFALRRSAIGILRIIIEKKLNFDLDLLIKESISLYGERIINAHVKKDIIEFIFNRLHQWYRYRGYSNNVIQAVLACHITNLMDLDIRIQVISYFCTLKEFSQLIKANKRITNILLRSQEQLNKVICTTMLKDETEIKLFDTLLILSKKFQLYLNEGRYQEILFESISLNKIIDEFFEKVMVNVHDKKIRINRLALLLKLRELLLQVADISLLE